MDVAALDKKLLPINKLLLDGRPQLALDRLHLLIQQEKPEPEVQWRILQRLADCYFNLFELKKAREYYWQSLMSPQGLCLRKQQELYSNYLLLLHNFSDVSDDEMRKKHFLFNQLCKDVELYPHERKDKKKLRVAYIAFFFAETVVSYFSMQLLARYDRSRYEVYCYSIIQRDDNLTAVIKDYIDVWRDFPAGITLQEVASRIYEDDIDILFDLTVHTAGGKTLPVLAYKPAPIQIAGIGYMSTTGMKTVDYFLTDVYCDPPGEHDEDFSEKLVRLPHSHFCYTPPEMVLRCKKSYKLHEPIIFGSFNNFTKITNEMLAVWLQILQRVPGSKILLKNSSSKPYAIRAMRKRMKKAGFDEGQFELENATYDYLDRYMDVDILLDTYPYTGGGTTCDALYRGVPMISKYGSRRHGSRFTYSILRNVGVGELAVQTDQEYIDRAVALAGDKALLLALHHALPERMKQSPVMNGKQYVQEVEAAYEEMWSTWLKG